MSMFACRLITLVTLLVVAEACGDRNRSTPDSVRVLPPVFPGAPAANAGWNPDAGSVMIAPFDNSTDTAAVIIPDATDSTVSIVASMNAPVAGLTFDLFGRGGKIASGIRSVPIPAADTSKLDCYGWPLARVLGTQSGWGVGFTSGRSAAIALDSIEALRGSDSASLAASLTRAAATLPSVSDPTFRGLPFRVRSAYTFRIDSVEVVVADVIRAVNEEANPRIEHILIVGERMVGSSSTYNVRYSNRTAGSEESTQASELLAVLSIGQSKRPTIVISIDYGDGNRFGILERISGEWRVTWRSAYTDC
jgi:hypothetical protein